jgi:hypothetical protein
MMTTKEHLALLIESQAEFVGGFALARTRIVQATLRLVQSRVAAEGVEAEAAAGRELGEVLDATLTEAEYCAAEILTNLRTLLAQFDEPMPRVPYTAPELRELAATDPRVRKVLADLAAEGSELAAKRLDVA